MEVAKRLAKTGVQVESVMLLDTILPDGYRRHLLQRLRHSAAGAVGHIGALWRMASRLVSRRNNAAVNLADEHMVAAKASRPGLEMERQVSKWLLDLEPPSWPVVLLRASDNSVWGQGYELLEDYGWGRRLGDRLTVIRVDGDHLGILSTPHVNKLVAEVCALRKTWV
jgi:thioesterase domain-containing protein